MCLPATSHPTYINKCPFLVSKFLPTTLGCTLLTGWPQRQSNKKKGVGLRRGYIHPVNHRGLVSQGVPLHTKYGPWGLECYRFLQWMAILRLSVQAIRTGKISALSALQQFFFLTYFNHIVKSAVKIRVCCTLRRNGFWVLSSGFWVVSCLYRCFLTSYVLPYSFLHCCYCVVEAPHCLPVPGCLSWLQGGELTREDIGITCPKARLSI